VVCQRGAAVMSLLSCVDALLDQTLRGGHIILRDSQRALTGDEFLGRARELSAWLKSSGCQVLALHADNGIDWVIVDIACQFAGVILVPVPPFVSPDQVARCLASSGAQLLLCGSDVPASDRIPGSPERALPAWLGLRGYRLDSPPGIYPEGTQKI